MSLDQNIDWIAGPNPNVLPPQVSVNKVTRVAGSDSLPMVGGLALGMSSVDSGSNEPSGFKSVESADAEAGTLLNRWGDEQAAHFGHVWGNDNPGGQNWGE